MLKPDYETAKSLQRSCASSLQGTAGRQYNAYCHFAKAVAEKEEIFSAGKCGGTGAVGQIFVSGM